MRCARPNMVTRALPGAAVAAGVVDPSSPSGLTDPIRYRAAIEQYTAGVLAASGLCPRGYADLMTQGGEKPYATAIT